MVLMPEESKITPWEVKGDIDYERLVKDFGVRKIDDAVLKSLETHGKLHHMLSRGFYFAHRDLDILLKEHEQGKDFFLYTGRAPTGPMHIGHLTPFLCTKWFQDTFKANLYIQIPDEEKFLAKKGVALETADKWMTDNICDIIALGFDPDKTFIFQNREFAQNMYTAACRIAKKITFSTVKSVFGFTNETNIGHIFYPAMQMVPCFFEKERCLIPAAIDQDPYWRVVRDVSESFGFPKPAQIHSQFLPPLTGTAGKMSTSEQQHAVFLNDDAVDVKHKIMKYAFSGGQATIEEHRAKGGNPDIDVSFQWLKILFENDDLELKRIEADYRSGKLLTGELKLILVEKMLAFLEQHQKAKNKAEKQIDKFKYKSKLARKMWQWKDFVQ